ncbi:MAG: HAMP domain-containing protein [Spirulina sp. SIO3F2]|nr:HAMP domain-containing protein [Spirulina sp. SIO3F2]
MTSTPTPFPRIPLRWLLTAPFVLQVFGGVGLVGYLSWRTGQQVVNDLASQLRSELTARIEQRLQSYVAAPHVINRLNATAVQEGTLALAAEQGSEQLLQQIKVSLLTNGIYCGDGQGNFFGVTRQESDARFERHDYLLMTSNAQTYFNYHLYDLNNRGTKTYFVDNVGRYDPRQRPWYRAALRQGKATWSEVYLDFSSGLPTVTASYPIYAENQILGVCGVDVVLSEELREFLQQLEIGKSGETFIMERSGALIASSTDEAIASGEGKQAIRLQAVDSQSSLIGPTAQFLQDHYGDFAEIRREQQLEFRMDGQLQFVQVVPFRDGRGLDWLIVLVVPEADFTGQIQANIRNTVILCGLALLVAAVIGVFTAQRLSRPILHLSHATQAIAAGQWQQQLIGSSKVKELNAMAESFNSMVEQLQASFARLETQRNSFARFVPVEYLEFLCRDSLVNVQLGEHVSKEMAIFFSDIRGFTTLSEMMTPQDTFEFINAYLGAVSPAVGGHGGFIVKYMGDGVMAAFPTGAKAAIESSLEQLVKVNQFNEQQEKSGKPRIAIGIGLHVGKVMVGIVGEANRMQGDAFSDHVNLASRLEGLTKFYGCALLVSESVVQGLSNPEDYDLRFLDRVVVKGRTEPIAIYEVLDAEPTQTRQLKLQTQAEFDQGVAAYTQGDLAAARQKFERLLGVHSGDRAALLYLNRIRQLEEQGLPLNWQGVWQFHEK